MARELGYLAVQEGRPDQALVLLYEASARAESAGARGILRWAEESRTNLQHA
ncbi:hypothetical protein [Micromonospora coerulea]|uniref:hypothetical protein n=1 Tax=Micromonospora coerulea TaxID=47856 RepID=UPI001906A2A4|nr:hypothetical protein [Micromonospora veneta]